MAELESQIADLEQQLESALSDQTGPVDTFVDTTQSPVTAPTVSSTPATDPPASTTSEPQDVLIHGELILEGLSTHFIGQTYPILLSDDETRCVGHGGFDDIGPNTQVTVRDEGGSIIAVSSIVDVYYVEIQPVQSEIGIGECHFVFEVVVPSNRLFYSFEAADRADVTYSRHDLESSEWLVLLQLGS